MINSQIHVKYSLLLEDFYETWIFLIDFWRVLKQQISSQVG